jgi:hypothetical protein
MYGMTSQKTKYAVRAYSVCCCQRFTSHEDNNWLSKTQHRVVSEEMGENLAAHVEPFHYFTEFLR